MSQYEDKAGMELSKVAVIGADSPIGLTLVRELGANGFEVIAFGKSAQSISRNSRYASAFEILRMPLSEHLPTQLAQHGISAAFVVSENDLLELAPIKADFAPCKLLIPDIDKLQIVLDKRRTLEIADQLGIGVPASWQPKPGEDFATIAASQTFPVAVKWSNPEAVIADLKANNLELEKVEYASSPDALLALLARYDALQQWPLVQYCCPGYGLGQMFNMHNGAATLRFQHKRLREWPPTGGVSTFCASVPLGEHAAQQKRSEELLREIGWEGTAMVEYRYDPETERYWLMEINGRFWGSIPLAFHCGVHFARELYRCQIDGHQPAQQQPYPSRKARYMIPDAKHIAKVLSQKGGALGSKLRALGAFTVGFLSPSNCYYVWNLRDPRPFMDDLMQIVRKLVRR